MNSDNLICRVCAVENGISRERRWMYVGPCPVCGEVHVLYKVKEREAKNETHLH